MPGPVNNDPLAGNTNPKTGTFLPPEATKDDGDGRKYVVWPDGSKFYLRPQAGSPLYFQGSNGGMLHNPDAWNPKTGQWEPGGVDWGKLGPWLGLAGIGGGVAAAALASTAGPAAVSAANASAAGGSAAGLGPSTAANIAATSTAAGSVPAALAPSVGGSVAGAGLGSLGWASLAANVGSQAVGAYLQNKANNKATDAQSKAAAEALAFLKDKDARQYAELEKYRNLGAGALDIEAGLLGIPLPKGNPVPINAATDPNHIQPGQPFPASMVPGSPLSGTPQTAPYPGGTLAQIGQAAIDDHGVGYINYLRQQQGLPTQTAEQQGWAGLPDNGIGSAPSRSPASGGTVRVQAPDGSVRLIPAGLQTMAIAQGGKVLA